MTEIKGPERGEKPQYFPDPAVDALYQMMLVLAEELAVLRERVDGISVLVAQEDRSAGDSLDTIDLGTDYDAVRKAFVTRLLEPLRDLAARDPET